MKVGIDIDGVLAEFCSSYQALFIKTTGRDLFQPGDAAHPPDWNWPTTRGYTKEETSAVWNAIRRNETFWLNLDPILINCSALMLVLHDLETRHEVYYLTDRSGIDAKRQTKRWLIDHLRYLGKAHTEPTVLLTSTGEKGHVARALKLDVFIDDKPSNCEDVVFHSPSTRVYYPVRSYNIGDPVLGGIRVGGAHGDIADMLDAEIALGNL